jgi:tRNA (guanine-N7-)-methyltransferase
VVEIGFGMGEATALMAAADPRRLLAIEVHWPGIAALLRRLESGALDNVRVVEGDAVEVLRELPERALQEVRAFFPDPWPKARHHKRRLIQPEFAALVAQKLTPRGRLHVATDDASYAEQVLDVLRDWDAAVVPRPENRPLTGYERRGLAAGRTVVDIIASPRDAAAAR